MKVPALLKNKYVCYALMALAALNIIGYVTVKAWECLALFSLAGYSAHCYCKNVSLAILAALFVANFVFGCGRVKEGFEDALAGPVEKMAEASGLLREAKAQCSDHSDKDACAGGDGCDWDKVAKVCADAANATAAAIDYTKFTTEATCSGADAPTPAGSWTPATCDGGQLKADKSGCENPNEGEYVKGVCAAPTV